MGFKPLQDWVLIKRAKPKDVTPGGIIIPDSAKDTPSEGIVLAVGPGRYEQEKHKKDKKEKKEKKFIPTVLKPGQHIMFTDFMVQEVELIQETITLIREDDVLGIIEGLQEVAVKQPFNIETKKDHPVLVQEKPEKKPARAPEKKKEEKDSAPAKGPQIKKEVKQRKPAPAKKQKKAAAAKKKTKPVTKTLKPAKAVAKKAAKKAVPKKTVKKVNPVKKKTVKKSASPAASGKKKTPVKTVAKKTPAKKAAKAGAKKRTRR